MDLNTLKKFAQGMRRDLISQMDARIEYVLKSDDEYLRAHSNEKKKIMELEKGRGRAELVEEAAYLWFNRLAAFRYMDSRGYASPRLVSPRSGESQPELLAEIKQGRIPAEIASRKAQFDAILSGRIKAVQPDREVYKEALLYTCNAWASRMPWLFAKVDDWVSLLLPQDLLSQDSLVARMVEGLSDADCAEGVEIIGWLYQFYISEKKDEVFALLKKNVKIAKENIPAATQLFTPHWIVRFMVENSLGRLWLLNRPDSLLKERMKYFVESDAEPDFLKVKDPTELKCLDPCCGSGHILAYFFELLYAIYEEEGYAPQEIPSLIIEKNIYGIDIDERAAELAAFSLAMVAREKDKRFFERGIQPNVIAMRDAHVNLKKLGVRLSPDLQESVELLKEGRNYGSLIPVPAGAAGEIHEVETGIDAHRFDDLFGAAELEELKAAFRILEYLEPRYQVVVTNPPYMNSSGMNNSLKKYLAEYYDRYKSDLFSAFVSRCFDLSLHAGNLAFMTPFVWMFLSSYEELRREIQSKHTVTSLVQLEYSGFSGATVPICSYSVRKGHIQDYRGGYIRLSDFRGSETQGPKTIEALQNENCSWFYRKNQNEFLKIPGMPMAYWLTPEAARNFDHGHSVSSFAKTRIGLITGENDRYIRKWHEVAIDNIGFSFDRLQAKKSGIAWFPISMGGDFRKWYGNHNSVVFWKDDGNELQTRLHSSSKRTLAHNFNLDKIFDEGITWTMVSSGLFSARMQPKGFLFNAASCAAFTEASNIFIIIGILCSKVANFFLPVLNPTLNYLPGNIGNIPMHPKILDNKELVPLVSSSISISKADWDSRETSWDFIRSPLISNYIDLNEKMGDGLNKEYRLLPTGISRDQGINLSSQLVTLIEHCTKLFFKLHENEERVNAILIEEYALSNEMTPEVPFTQITILEEEIPDSGRKEGRLEFNEEVLARQFLSYGVGCIMGRYSAEKDGLILADEGSTIHDFKHRIPDAIFLPDEDGILPITDEDDFQDDLPTAFRAWLRHISGVHYDSNLRWIEERIGKDLRSFFDRDFYKDHVRRYKSRPIYWMVSSPSGAFRALIYLHRYTKDTVGKILNDYVRPYRTKIDQKIRGLESIIDSSGSSAGEKSKAKKRIAQLEKYRTEIEAWEKESLYPLALKRVELDLDDGVKVNYRKLEGILEPVKQLEAKEEE